MEIKHQTQLKILVESTLHYVKFPKSLRKLKRRVSEIVGNDQFKLHYSTKKYLRKQLNSKKRFTYIKQHNYVTVHAEEITDDPEIESSETIGLTNSLAARWAAEKAQLIATKAHTLKSEAQLIESQARDWANRARWQAKKLKDESKIRYDDGFFLGTYTGNHIKERHGYGVLSLHDNRRMEGLWNQDDRVMGMFYWYDGNTIGDWYIGEQRDHDINGLGVYYVDNGDIYYGEKRASYTTGLGVYEWKDGSIYAGQLKKDRSCGLGVHQYANGDVYLGEWTDDDYSGFGKLIWHDGRVYEGLWLEGFEHGSGILTLPDGRGKIAQEWNGGTLVYEHNLDDI